MVLACLMNFAITLYFITFYVVIVLALDTGTTY